MADITIDLHLYGALARYSGGASSYGSAHVKISLREGSTIRDLLAHLGLPTEERGITFINGNLSAMPGLQPDLDHRLNDGDRVAFFDLKSMWPFQYRNGAGLTEEMARAMSVTEGKGIRHTYKQETGLK